MSRLGASHGSYRIFNSSSGWDQIIRSGMEIRRRNKGRDCSGPWPGGTQQPIQSGPWIIEHAKEFPPIPLLVLQGCSNRFANPAATQQFAENVPGDKTFVMWDGGYHELHNELEKDEIVKILIDWLDKHNTPILT